MTYPTVWTIRKDFLYLEKHRDVERFTKYLLEVIYHEASKQGVVPIKWEVRQDTKFWGANERRILEVECLSMYELYRGFKDLDVLFSRMAELERKVDG